MPWGERSWDRIVGAKQSANQQEMLGWGSGSGQQGVTYPVAQPSPFDTTSPPRLVWSAECPTAVFWRQAPGGGSFVQWRRHRHGAIGSTLNLLPAEAMISRSRQHFDSSRKSISVVGCSREPPRKTGGAPQKDAQDGSRTTL